MMSRLHSLATITTVPRYRIILNWGKLPNVLYSLKDRYLFIFAVVFCLFVCFAVFFFFFFFFVVFAFFFFGNSTSW